MHKSGKKRGSYLIGFMRGDERKYIYLGKVPKRAAEKIKGHVEDVIAASIGGVAVTPSTSQWLADIDDSLAMKLSKVGLIEPRKSKEQLAVTTLGEFTQAYIGSLNIKPSTRVNLNRARHYLTEYFGKNKPLAAITLGDADDWRRWLTIKLADNTMRRYCGRAKQFFRAAVRKKLIAENPFADMKDCKVSGNRERDYFVTLADAQKVLDACPDVQWRLLFALSRFGGLRCPSEHALLQWSQVDFERNRMTVLSPKTEHHEGHDKRVVPIFAELRPYLETARAEASRGEEHLITIPAVERFRRGTGKKPNLGTRMQKIIRQAGLTPWPKLFQNLRTSRQTELAKRFPEHVVCEWIGNSQVVAREHYLRVTEEDYANATSEVWVAKWVARGAENGSQNGHSPGAAQSSLLLQIVQKVLEEQGLEQFGATVGKALQNYQAPRAQPSSKRVSSWRFPQLVSGQDIADLASDSVAANRIQPAPKPAAAS
jgi:integrase